MKRRDFMKVVSAAAPAAAASGLFGSVDVFAAAGPPGDKPERPKDVVRGDMRYRPLGKSGEEVSVLGVGGYHIGVPPEEEGIKIIRTAIDAGVTFMDNSWDYHDGAAKSAWARPSRTATARRSSS